MSFVPHEYDDDSDFDDGLMYANDPLAKVEIEEPRVPASLLTQSIAEPTKRNDGFEWGELRERQAFLVAPKPELAQNGNSGRSFIRSPTPSALILDDIRSAVIVGNLEFLKKQVEDETRPFFIDTILKAGWTTLMYAASFANAEIVEYCLDQKADPNFHKEQLTALMIACSSQGDEEDLLKCVKLLIKHNANVQAHDKFKNTPLMFAARKGRMRIVKELLDHGAEISPVDGYGFTALHIAAQSGHGAVVRVLLEAGADVGAITQSGQTAADIAFGANHEDIAQIIERVRKNEDRSLTETEIATLETKKPGGVIFNYTSSATESPTNVAKQRKKYPEDLEIFLCGLNLSEYLPVFDKHNISLRYLMRLEEDDLIKMGVEKVGDRKKLLDSIVGIMKTGFNTTSLPNLRSVKQLSCPDAVVMMSNIAKHLAYIETTVAYIRCQVKKDPKTLELGQDRANVLQLFGDVNECLRNTRLVFDEVRFFKRDLLAVKENAEFYPADLIGPTELSKDLASDEESRLPKQLVITGAALVAAGLVVLKYQNGGLPKLILKF